MNFRKARSKWYEEFMLLIKNILNANTANKLYSVCVIILVSSSSIIVFLFLDYVNLVSNSL